MKKTIACAIAMAMLFSCVVVNAAFTEGGKPSVVVTIFPIYDWVREIAGDAVDMTLLLDSGVDLHSYQPTAQDILKVASCDLFIHVGGESDEWVEGVLQQSVNPDQRVINLMEALGDAVRKEETVEGMEAEEAEKAEKDEVEYDEHVWLSLKNAEKLVEVIGDTLKDVDPGKAETFTVNAADYEAKLFALDARFAAAVEAGTFDTLLFGDRFPFRYLVDDYGLSYYAAFSGCSAESEASFETVAFLAGKVDELGLPAVMTIEGSNNRIAETIVQNTTEKNQRILTLDSLQSTTMKDAEAGKTYLGAMENNLAVLTEALNQ